MNLFFQNNPLETFEFIALLHQKFGILAASILILLLLLCVLSYKFLVARFELAGRQAITKELATFKSELISDIGTGFLNHNSTLSQDLEKIKSELILLNSQKLNLSNQERKYLVQVNDDISAWVEVLLSSIFRHSSEDEYNTLYNMASELSTKVQQSVGALNLFISDKLIMVETIRLKEKINNRLQTFCLTKAKELLQAKLSITAGEGDAVAYTALLSRTIVKLEGRHSELLDDIYALRNKYRILLGVDSENQESKS